MRRKSRLHYKSRQTIKTRLSTVPPFIDVAGGKAKFLCTEVESSEGKWNDDYQTRDGYWVIHHGNRHHVYFLKPEVRE